MKTNVAKLICLVLFLAYPYCPVEASQQVRDSNDAVWKNHTYTKGSLCMLLSDSGKTLWVGTSGGLLERDYATGRLERVYTDVDGLPGNRIDHLSSDGADGIWIETGEGLAHIFSDRTIKVYDAAELAGAPDALLTRVIQDGAGELWIGFKDHGLVHFRSNGIKQVYNRENSGMPSDYVTALMLESSGKLWIGTDMGLACLRLDNRWEVFDGDRLGVPGAGVSELVTDW